MKKKNIFVRYKLARISAIAAFIIVAGIISFRSHSGETRDVSGGTLILETSGDDRITEKSDAIPDDTEDPEKCFVYVCGEVQNPGVYECTSGTRLGTLVDMAGGTTPDADLTSVNLAREVTDGEQVIILKKGVDPAVSSDVQPVSSGSASGSGLININTADETALKTLPGIGDAKAKAIVTYRTQNGLFKTKEDIMNISGIKNAAFDKIKDLITI